MKTNGKRHGLAVVAVLTAVGMAAAACSFQQGKAQAQSAQCGNGTQYSAASGAAGADGIPPASTSHRSFGQSAPGSCTYKGPGNFTLNLKKCPSSWNNSAGITKTGISLFTSMPHSGALAAYGAIGDGINSYLDYVNAHGGIYGRKVSLKIMDDQYQPNLTAQNVNNAIQSGGYAASFAILGSPNNLDVADTMNKQCMAQLMTAASDDQFGDPSHHPWTTGFGMDYDDETGIWANWLKSQFPSGAKVAEISIGNLLGQSYTAGFARAIKGTNFKVVGNEVNNVTAPNVTSQVTSAAATKAQVVLVNEAGTFCTQAFAAIEQSSWHPVVIASNACAQISTVFAPLQKENLTGNGVHVVRYYYAPTDSDQHDPKFVALYTSTLKSQGLDPTNAQYANGWFWGWYIVQVLKDAGQLKGGLNRANIDIAAHSYDSVYPLMIPGAIGRTSGVTEAYAFQTGRMYEYAGATTKKLGTFVTAGPLVNEEGILQNWSQIQGGS
jgi:ABC-type branched-subunit amino acid transport system substrate-binding protein